MKLVKTDNPGYYKDSDSGVIINLDERPYNRIVSERKLRREQKEYNEKLADVERDLQEIKQMLLEIAQNRDSHETNI